MTTFIELELELPSNNIVVYKKEHLHQKQQCWYNKNPNYHLIVILANIASFSFASITLMSFANSVSAAKQFDFAENKKLQDSWCDFIHDLELLEILTIASLLSYILAILGTIQRSKLIIGIVIGWSIYACIVKTVVVIQRINRLNNEDEEDYFEHDYGTTFEGMMAPMAVSIMYNIVYIFPHVVLIQELNRENELYSKRFSFYDDSDDDDDDDDSTVCIDYTKLAHDEI